MFWVGVCSLDFGFVRGGIISWFFCVWLGYLLWDFGCRGGIVRLFMFDC